uniref:Alpha-mannosidase n=1 Tax=Salix viminalis TaxID=40686 RepID=A0A6N2KXU6_SALVM
MEKLERDLTWFVGWVLIAAVVVFGLHGAVVNGGYVNYNTGGGVVPGKLNVHLVPHSHDDVGWLKTVDQYYVGSNNSIQGACVENVLDSVVESLRRDSNRKFVFVEMRWWVEQSEEIQEQVRKLVDAGQLEFVNGGWCMHDEATCHYIDMIDQTTLGHRAIKEQFNKTPRAGWQIDPFGHSAVQAYLLGTELGFDSVHFARIDYQDRAKRKGNKALEVIWRGSKTFGSSSQIFANAFPVHYSPPSGFHFEVFDNFVPVQDNPLLDDYNVEQRVNDFINAAMTQVKFELLSFFLSNYILLVSAKESGVKHFMFLNELSIYNRIIPFIMQANVTRTNHIMWTMGDDFQYQYAESWFKQMDKFIHYVNKDGRVNALYSTPSIYTDVKNAANESWPLKTDDYFPYADGDNSYWTGFFTSRPALKRYVRQLSGYYLAARQLEFLVGKKSTGPNTYRLGDALGIAQHHDGVTGTAKQHTTNDYEKRLAIGAVEAEATVSSALSCLVSNKSTDQCEKPALSFSQCQLLNISYCPPTEEAIANGKTLVMVVYNALGWNRNDIIRIPVNDPNLVVSDSDGKHIKTQYVSMDNTTSNLRNFYLKAYGFPSIQVPRYWLHFQVSVPPLGWSTYFISSAPGIGKRRNGLSVMDSPQNDTIEIGSGNLKLSFSSMTGHLKRMYNSKTGVDVPIKQSYLWYGSSSEGTQSSGAYIFRPDGSPPHIVARSVPLQVHRGPLFDEVRQQFNSWIYQVTRVYKDQEHAELEYTIGPIPLEDSVGKEVITRMTANMATEKVFYTDSNGRDFLKRIRDYRADWSLSVKQPVAGNYYPLNLGIFMMDKKSELSVLVDRATGGASIEDGQLELMLHRFKTSNSYIIVFFNAQEHTKLILLSYTRRTLFDDSRGVNEALDESVCIGDECEGLTIRGNYYLCINQVGAGAAWRRTTGQEIYSPLIAAFTQEKEETWKASHVATGTAMDPDYSLPLNVALITLQELDDGSVLLRLAHLYEAGEDAAYSTLAKVELKKMFSGKAIRELKEMSLSTNQEKSEMKKMTWKVEGDSGEQSSAVRGGPVDSSTLIVELGPMEIRTFLLQF